MAVAQRLPAGVHVQQVHEEVVRELAGAVGEHTVLAATGVGAQHAQAAHEHRHLRCTEGEQLGAVHEHLLGGDAVELLLVVAEAVGLGLHHGEALHVGLLLAGVHAARVEGHGHVMPGVLGGLLHGGTAGQHDQVGQGDLLAVLGGGVELLLDAFQGAQHLGQLVGVVHRPEPLGGQAHAGPVGTAALVAAAEGAGTGPGGAHELADAQPGGEHLGLEGGDVGVVDQGVVHRGDGVLPDQVLFRHLRSQVQALGAHVPVRELEPGAGEGVGELLGVRVETPADLLVDRVVAHGHVRGGHRGAMLLAGIVRVLDHVLGLHVLGAPLVGTGGALGQLPFVAEEHVEVAHVPLGGIGLPGALQAAGGGVAALAGAVGVHPAQALQLDGRGLGLGAHQAGVAGAMHLAEGVSAGGEGHGLLVVHGHALEGLAHVLAAGHGVGIAVRTFGVHVDQAHLHGREGVLEVALAGVAAVGLVAGGQPLVLGTPVHVLLRGPDVRPASTEAEGLEAHALQGHVAGQDEEVGPADAVAVLLLDGPQQAAGLVQVAVVRPAVDGCEALVAGASATAAVGGAVGAGGVPGHADHEAAVVTVVRRPPILRVGHQVGQVLLQGLVVQLLERLSVVEVGVHGVGHRLVLVQDGEVQAVRPPIAVAGAPASDRKTLCAVHHGALAGRAAVVVHVVDLALGMFVLVVRHVGPSCRVMRAKLSSTFPSPTLSFIDNVYRRPPVLRPRRSPAAYSTTQSLSSRVKRTSSRLLKGMSQSPS